MAIDEKVTKVSGWKDTATGMPIGRSERISSQCAR